MSLTRFIITIQFETAREGAAVDGGPSKTLYVAHATSDIEAARRFGEKLLTEGPWTGTPSRWPGGKVASVKAETRTHNIPCLDPESWKRLEEKSAELNARIQGF